jgi:hypothetical protein
VQQAVCAASTPASWFLGMEEHKGTAAFEDDSDHRMEHAPVEEHHDHPMMRAPIEEERDHPMMRAAKKWWHGTLDVRDLIGNDYAQLGKCAYEGFRVGLGLTHMPVCRHLSFVEMLVMKKRNPISDPPMQVYLDRCSVIVTVVEHAWKNQYNDSLYSKPVIALIATLACLGGDDLVDCQLIQDDVRRYMQRDPSEKQLLKTMQSYFGLLTVKQFCFILSFVVKVACEGFENELDHHTRPYHYSLTGLCITKAFFRVHKDLIASDLNFERNARLEVLFHLHRYNADVKDHGFLEKYVSCIVSIEHAANPVTEMKVLFLDLLLSTYSANVNGYLELYNAEVALCRFIREEATKSPEESEFPSFVQMVVTVSEIDKVSWLRVLLGCCTDSGCEQLVMNNSRIAWFRMARLLEEDEDGFDRAALSPHELLINWAFLLWTSNSVDQEYRAMVKVHSWKGVATDALCDASSFSDWPDLTNSKKLKRLPLEIVQTVGFNLAYSKAMFIAQTLKSVSGSLDGLPGTLIAGFTGC